MKSPFKNLLTGILKRQRRESITFTGNYMNWDAAMRDSMGYDASVILKRTREAMLKVKSGEAAYERDSVLFDQVQYSFPLLAGLLRAAVAGGGRLCVLDFGGALGSSYFQCRSFLKPIPHLLWLVVEQSGHVACGKHDFESDQLRFYVNVEPCVADRHPNTLLLSSVLQYLPEPYVVLANLLRYPFDHVLIDRTAFLATDHERLTVQTVPASIYPASYPAWFLSETKLTEAVTKAGYCLVTEFPKSESGSPADEDAYFKGFLFERRVQS